MKLYRVIIILIFLLSAIFRLGFHNEIVFIGDDNSIALSFYDLAKNKQFPPLLSQGKTGLYAIHILDRVPYYIFMLFVKDPRILTILFTGIPNALAVMLCFLFCYRFINKRVALLSAGVFGFSGWHILHSRNLWALNLQPFYTILLFSSLLYFIYYHKPWSIITTVLLALLTYNLHPTSLSLIGSIFLILLVYGYICRNKYLLLSFLFGGAMIIPLLIVYKKANIITPNFSLKPFIYFLKLITRDDWYYSYLRVDPEYPLAENFNTIFMKAVFIFGCIYIIKRIFHSLKTKEFTPYIVIGAWIFSFTTGFGFTAMRYHTHYFIVVFPALFIISAIGFDSLINYAMGREKIEKWEIFLALSIFTFLDPLAIAVLPLTNIRLNKKVAAYSLYSCMIFILSFQSLTTLKLYNSIKNNGGVTGIPRLDLGSKINTVKFIIQDAQERYRQTGLPSGYSIENDEGFEYIFKYLAKGEMDFLSEELPPGGFRYRIIADANREWGVDENKNYIAHKRIGSKLVIIERINEK